MESPLYRFFRPDPASELVLGTYLYPYRLLGTPDWDEPYSASKVVAQTGVASHVVMITRSGGLFLRPPLHLGDALACPDSEPG